MRGISWQLGPALGISLTLAGALAALLPSTARSQTTTIADRAGGLPTGLAGPGAGVATADEPAATAVNPAAAGLNGGFTFQYLHEQARRTSDGDGLYLGLGSLALTSEWVRPAGAPRYRRTALALGLGGPDLSLGGSWNNWSSPDAGLEALRTFDLGITVRPSRWLSVGAAAFDLDGRRDGQALARRYTVGAATRQLDDALTLWADLHADDDRRNAFRSRAISFGAAYEGPLGLALGGQVQVPIERGAGGVRGSTLFLLSAAVNHRFSGLIVAAGGTGRRDEGNSALGLRLSSRAYRGYTLPPRPVLLDLRRELDPPRGLPFLDRVDPYQALLDRLHDLRDDPEVGPVLLKVGGLPAGGARAEELRRAIEELRARKPVVAWLEGAGMREYYVASAASRIEMPPAAALALTGLSSTSLYLRDTFAKIGVAFEVVSIGKYKSAGDTLARGDMAEADREQRQAMLDDVFERWVNEVAAARRLAAPKVRELVDEGVFAADDALKAGLVDGVGYLDELEARLHLSSGSGGWSAPAPRLAQRWGPRPAVALIQVSGMIVPGRSRGAPLTGGLAGADSIAKLLERAAQDGGVKAIVVRIDSPGGDALASDLILRALRQARQRKPVVVSMGDVAASGGYWIACGADEVVAGPSTVTGSIGVIGVKPDLSGLLAKLDAHPAVLKRGARADLFSPSRPWSADERAALERNLAATYGLFVARVAEGRGLPRDEVERLAQGRVWTGRQALQRKLVDRLGALDDAVAAARRRAGIAAGDEVELRVFSPPRALLEELGAGLGGADGLTALLGLAPEIQTAAALTEMGPALALPELWLRPLGESGPEGSGR